MLVCHKIFILTSATITKTPPTPTVRPNQGLTGWRLASATKTGFVFILKEWSFSYGCVRCNVSDPIFDPDIAPWAQTTKRSAARDVFIPLSTFLLPYLNIQISNAHPGSAGLN